MLCFLIKPKVTGLFFFLDLIFHLDDVPLHCSCVVHVSLDRHLSRRWIGRLGPISWLPKSPKPTPMDFYFWGYAKGITYLTKPMSLKRDKRQNQEYSPQSLQHQWFMMWKMCWATNDAYHYNKTLRHSKFHCYT